MSEVSKAHGKELSEMNAANAVMKAQVEKALANVKDFKQQTVDRQAENSALQSQLEKEVEGTSKKLGGLGKKCQEQDDRIQQLREELACNQKLLADNKKKDDQVIASGKAEIQALKAQVSALEKHLKETHEEGKDQVVQLKAQVAVLDRKLEGAALEIADLDRQFAVAQLELFETRQKCKVRSHEKVNLRITELEAAYHREVDLR